MLGLVQLATALPLLGTIMRRELERRARADIVIMRTNSSEISRGHGNWEHRKQYHRTKLGCYSSFNVNMYSILHYFNITGDLNQTNILDLLNEVIKIRTFFLHLLIGGL